MSKPPLQLQEDSYEDSIFAEFISEACRIAVFVPIDRFPEASEPAISRSLHCVEKAIVASMQSQSA